MERVRKLRQHLNELGYGPVEHPAQLGSGIGGHHLDLVTGEKGGVNARVELNYAYPRAGHLALHKDLFPENYDDAVQSVQFTQEDYEERLRNKLNDLGVTDAGSHLEQNRRAMQALATRVFTVRGVKGETKREQKYLGELAERMQRKKEVEARLRELNAELEAKGEEEEESHEAMELERDKFNLEEKIQSAKRKFAKETARIIPADEKAARQRHEVLNGKLAMLGLKPAHELRLTKTGDGEFEAVQLFNGVGEAMRRSGLTEKNFERALAEEMTLRTNPEGERKRDSRLQYHFKKSGDRLEVRARHYRAGK